METQTPPVFSHIAWVVGDLDVTKDFLAKHFGFTASKPHHINGEWADKLACMKNVNAYNITMSHPEHAGATTIELLKFDHPSNLKSAEVDRLNLQGFRHIGFRVEDINAKAQELRDAGFDVPEAIACTPFNLYSLYFNGPESTVIQLSQAMKK